MYNAIEKKNVNNCIKLRFKFKSWLMAAEVVFKENEINNDNNKYTTR